MARKVFISFLGTTDYDRSMYYVSKKRCSNEEKYVQIPALQFLRNSKTWTKDDVAYILLTESAEKRNWIDNGYIDKHGKPNVGLETELNKQNFPFSIKPIKNIPEWSNEVDMWKTFKIVYDLIEEGDELYFDITHGFRYLPMLVVVLGNYAKFLKKAEVKHIYYGNYEGRDKDENGKFAKPACSPLIDLISLSTLQDWTYAVIDFIKNGNAERMRELTNVISEKLIKKGDERASALKMLVFNIGKFATDMQTCRGSSIVEADNIRRLKESLKEMKEFLANEEEKYSVDQLLIPVFEEIQKTIDEYSPEQDIANGFEAVKWCLNHHLYQQAITILQETIITYFCNIFNFDEHSFEDRKLMGEIVARRDAEEEIIDKSVSNLKFINKMHRIRKKYNELRIMRNDFNHAGFIDDKIVASELEEEINEKCNFFMSELLQ